MQHQPILGTGERCPVLSRANAGAREFLVAQSRFRHLNRGESLYLSDTPARCCYVIVRGWMKRYRILPNGAEAVIRLHPAGETLGFMDALRGQLYSAGAEAIAPSVLLEVPVSAIERQIKADPDFARLLLTQSYEHIDELHDQVESLKCRTGVQRLAKFLLREVRERNGRYLVVLPYERNLVAAYLGLKPESLSRAFAKLRNTGVRSTREGIEIDDLDALREISVDDCSEAWRREA